MKVYVCTKINEEEFEREELIDPTPQKIESKAKEIAQYNERQADLYEKGLINNPKIKLLIT